MAKNKHNDLSAVRQIWMKMDVTEQETVFQFLSAFNKKFGEYEPKTLKLLKYISDITNPKDLDGSVAKKELFPEMSDAAYTKLVSRLRDKLLEAWVLDVNLDRKGAYAPSWVVRQKTRKKLIYIEQLINKGNYFEAGHLLAKASRESLKYELYELYMSLQQLEYIMLCKTKGAEYAEHIFESFPVLSEKLMLKMHTEQLLYRYHFWGRNKGGSYTELSKLRNSLQMISKHPRLSEVPTSKYHFLHLRILFAEQMGSFDSIFDITEDLRELMVKHEHLALPVRFANLHLQQFTAALHLHLFPDALRYVQMALPYLNNASKASTDIRLMHFLPLLHLKRWKDAEEMLAETSLYADKLYEASESNPFLEKLSYYKACLSFAQGEYSEATRILSTLNSLLDDKDGWNIGIRVLLIQCRIAKGAYDVAESQIDNLRRQLERNGKLRKLAQREVIILRVLHHMSKADFNPSAIAPRVKDMVELLNDQREGYRWDPFGSEVIPFQSWYNEWANPVKRKQLQSI
jgi:hypothetical protein